jgi:hypothetical protein
MPALDRSPQCRALTENVLLPHELIEIPRPHPHRQGSIRSRNISPRRLTRIEQPISHAAEYDHEPSGRHGFIKLEEEAA